MAMAAYISGMKKFQRLLLQEKELLSRDLEFFEDDELLGSHKERAKISAVPGQCASSHLACYVG